MRDNNAAFWEAFVAEFIVKSKRKPRSRKVGASLVVSKPRLDSILRLIYNINNKRLMLEISEYNVISALVKCDLLINQRNNEASKSIVDGDKYPYTQVDTTQLCVKKLKMLASDYTRIFSKQYEDDLKKERQRLVDFVKRQSNKTP